MHKCQGDFCDRTENRRCGTAQTGQGNSGDRPVMEEDGLPQSMILSVRKRVSQEETENRDMKKKGLAVKQVLKYLVAGEGIEPSTPRL